MSFFIRVVFIPFCFIFIKKEDKLDALLLFIFAIFFVVFVVFFFFFVMCYQKQRISRDTF